jgi:hypothetical protein
MFKELLSKLKANVQDYQDRNDKKEIRKIQDHNFNLFLKQICDLDNLKILNQKCENEMDTSSGGFVNDQDCVKMNVEFESCVHIQAQIRSMYKIRQYNYFNKNKEKEL